MVPPGLHSAEELQEGALDHNAHPSTPCSARAPPSTTISRTTPSRCPAFQAVCVRDGEKVAVLQQTAHMSGFGIVSLPLAGKHGLAVPRCPSHITDVGEASRPRPERSNVRGQRGRCLCRRRRRTPGQSRQPRSWSRRRQTRQSSPRGHICWPKAACIHRDTRNHRHLRPHGERHIIKKRKTTTGQDEVQEEA